MYTLVVPTKHSLGVEPLIYNSHDDITPGALVEIPYKNALEYGIVVGSIGEAPENTQVIKTLSATISDVPLLAKYQLFTLIRIAQKYMIPIHRVLGFFLRQNILTRLFKQNIHTLTPPKNTKKGQKKRIFHTPLHTGVSQEMCEIYLHPYTVFIAPDDFFLKKLESWFGNTETLFLYKESTDTKKAQTWRDIYEKKYTIIFGNRQLLYYNLEAYDTIVYLEDAFGTEYFHYPTKIHYSEVLRNIADSFDGNIVILSTVSKLTHRVLFRDFTFIHE